jgi:hypothetical protein
MGTIISHIVNWLADGEEEKRLKGSYNQRRRPVRKMVKKDGHFFPRSKCEMEDF